LAQLGCAGYRKWFYGGIIAQICTLVNGFLKLLKECIKSLDRFLKNCYDVCSEPEKTMQAKVRVRHGKYKNDLLSQNRFGACIL
jgi:predicted HicB family RNase H-like nuclease